MSIIRACGTQREATAYDPLTRENLAQHTGIEPLPACPSTIPVAKSDSISDLVHADSSPRIAYGLFAGIKASKAAAKARGENKPALPVDLPKVNLRRGALGMAFPCEVATSVLRNETVNALRSQDIGRIAYKYLQCRKQQTFDRRLNICEAMILAVHTLPSHVRNGLLMKDTKRACKTVLQDRLGERFQEIQRLSCRTKDLPKLRAIIAGKNFETTWLDRKTAMGMFEPD